MAEGTSYIGVAMGLDVTDLKAGLSEANKQIQLANSEFRAASSGMEDWTKSSAGLSAKIKQLDTVLGLQEKKLAGLNREHEEIVKTQGANSEAARRLQVQINQQTAVVNKTKRELKNYRETLEGVEKGTIDLEKVTLRSGKAVEKAGKTVEKTGKQAKETGEGFTVATGAIATFVGNGLTRLVSAASNAIKSIMGLSDATREYRRTLATLDTAAGDVGVSTDFIRDKFTDLMGVFSDEASVTEGLNNLLTAGFDEKSLDSITKNLEGAALKWKDTLKFEGLADSLQEWIGSGGESLTGNFAELLERMGYNLEEVTEKTAGMTDEQRRNYAVNLLNKEGLGDVSKAYREQNADMVEAQKANTNYQNAVAKMGERLEPVMTKVREGFTKIIEKILELSEGVDLDAFAAKIEKGFGDFVDNTLPKIVDGIQWIIDNKDFLGIIAAAIGIVTGALAALNVVLGIQSAIMAANPTTWIVMAIIAAITALIAIVLLCIKHWDKIKEAGAAAWEWIKNAWSAAGEWFSNIGQSISEGVSKAWAKLKQGAADAWEGIKSVFSKVGSWFRDIFSDAWTKVKNVFSAGGKIFDGIKDGIITAFKKVVNAIIRGINKAISVPFNGLNTVLDKITGVDIAGVKPFGFIKWRATAPEIPELARGGVLEKGQVGLLEGDGAEAVVPLERNVGWIRRLAGELSRNLGLDVGSVKSGLSVGLGSGAGGSGRVGGSTVVHAGMTVNINGKLSRKELKRIENDNYTAIRTRLKKEGAF